MHAFKWLRVSVKWKKESMCAMSRTSERHQPRGKRKSKKKKIELCSSSLASLLLRSKRDFYGIISYGLKWFMIRVELVAAITTHYEHFKPPSQLWRAFHHPSQSSAHKILAYNSIHLSLRVRVIQRLPFHVVGGRGRRRSLFRHKHTHTHTHNVCGTTRSRITMQFTIIKNNTTILYYSVRRRHRHMWLLHAIDYICSGWAFFSNNVLVTFLAAQFAYKRHDRPRTGSNNSGGSGSGKRIDSIRESEVPLHACLLIIMTICI